KKFTLKMKTGEGGKLYGAVTAMDIASSLAESGYKVDKKNITIKNPIKACGTYEVGVKLHTKVNISVVIEVEAIHG
ncbi:MAG TPA: 50S ribosomal protein L9, partial [Bacillota bacterium]|nr:50S ribosomal protein L9 [Bacillota bacterium]